MSTVYKLLGVTAPETAPTTSDIIYPQNLRDQQGYVQFQIDDAGDTFTCVVESRMDQNAPWVRVMQFDQTDTNTFGGVGWLNRTMLTIALPMLPQVRLNLTAFTGTGGVSAWLVE